MPARTTANAAPTAYVRSVIRSLESGVAVRVDGDDYQLQVAGPTSDAAGRVGFVKGDVVDSDVPPPLAGDPERTDRMMRFQASGTPRVRPHRQVVETYRGKLTREVFAFDDGDEFQRRFDFSNFPNGLGSYRYRDGRSAFSSVPFPDRRDAPPERWGDGTYAGDWQAMLPHGRGAYSGPLGSYSGDWVQGRPDGQGAAQFLDGGRYEGEFRNGVPQGQGTYTWRDGVKFDGTFNGGQPATGKIIDRDGRTRDARGDGPGRDGRTRDNDLTATVTEYDPDGRKMSERSIEGMKIEGRVRSRDP